MRSADDSREAEHEPQRGNFYKRASNNGLAVVEGGYEDVSPIYHCSCKYAGDEKMGSLHLRGMKGNAWL